LRFVKTESHPTSLDASLLLENGAALENGPGIQPRFENQSIWGTGPFESNELRVEGKFLAVNGERFWIKAVTYGTFKENAQGEPFPAFEIVRDDFQRMRDAGVNSIRLYTPPPDRIADAAARLGLYLIPDIMWGPRRCELDDPARVRYIFEWVSGHARRLAQHPAILMFSIGNEIPPLVARWYGKKEIETFLRDIHHAVKEQAPRSLTTYAKHPPTEYLHLPFLDVESYNIYLEREPEFRRYLARLHQIVGERPLFISELGVDAAKHGWQAQAEMLRWQLRAVFEKGACGAAVYAWTDEWAIFEQEISKWKFGLTDIDRRARPSRAVVKEIYSRPVYQLRLKGQPRVSIVVTAFNAVRTIDQTLTFLSRLNYPDYEVIVVNDGSTDNTGELARRHNARVIDTRNQGLSAARNVGIEAATGEIVAFIDSDAFPDPDWLYFLVNALDEQDAAGVGGPNLIPPGDGFLAQCIDHAPGNPTHVLLNDELAEHVPGCNMAFKKEALLELGVFDPRHRVAGDDVDICWKLLVRRKRIAFSPCAIVWHHRRPSVRAFLKQQTGYGRAEAHLHRFYPGRFNVFGDMVWAGRIYDSSHNARRAYGLLPLFRPRIYQGRFGSAQFQSLYQPFSMWWFQIFTNAEWQLVAYCWLASGLIAVSITRIAWLICLIAGAGMLMVAALVGLVFGVEAARVKKWQWHRKWIGIGLVAALHIAQPLARMLGFARGWWQTRDQRLELKPAYRVWGNMEQRTVWLEHFQEYLASCGWKCRPSHEWDNADIDILGPGPYRLRFSSVYEERLERGFHMVRFRLVVRAKFALLLLWTIAVSLLVAVTIVWPYFFPFVIPVAAGLFGLVRARRHMLSAVSQLALECAESLGMTVVVEEWFV
jgi:cellulose synthase/poly-beta-1,6-N-acetylglucosamine synthase-like glycosyltransferase